jgi:hypothetical protein
MFYFDVTIVKVRTPFYITSKVKPIQMAKRGFDPEGKTFIYDDKPNLRFRIRFFLNILNPHGGPK